MINYTLQEFFDLIKYNPFLEDNKNIYYILYIETNVGQFIGKTYPRYFYKNKIINCWLSNNSVYKEDFEININESKIIPKHNNRKVNSYSITIDKRDTTEYIFFDSKEINSYRIFYKNSWVYLNNNEFYYYKSLEDSESDSLELNLIEYEHLTPDFFKSIKRNYLFL